MARDGDAAGTVGVSYDVTLRWPDGREETIRASSDESVLDAAERAGIALPFGCRTGACATCAARCCDGGRAAEAREPGGAAGRARDDVAADGDDESGTVAVEHARPPRALKERHLDDGFVLPCIAEPRRDCVLAVGSDVASELVSNPWK